MVTQKLTIRLDEKELPEIRMVSGDIGREIRIEVYAREDSDTPIDLETYSAEITIIKPDNTFIMDNFDGDEYELPEQAGAVSGSGYYQIKIFTAGSHQIYTGQGPFLVDDMILSDDVIESSSIAFGDRFPEDFATKTWVDDEIEAAGIGTYVAGNPAGEETMPPLVRLQINDDIYPLIHKVEEQEDADITNPAEGDVLTYDADDQKWKNEPLVIPDPAVTKTATGNPIEISDAASAPLVKCVTQITGYQQGSGTPSPDNIRPIVAYTEGEIEVRGKNLLPNGTVGGQYYSPEGNIITNAQIVSFPTILFTPGNYNMSFVDKTPTGTNSYIRMNELDENENFVSRLSTTQIHENTFKFSFFRNAYVQFAIDIYLENIMLVQGFTPSTYETYTANTHTTTYPSAIYRGSEDVVNGTAREEWIKKSTFNFTYSGTFGNNIRFEFTMNNGGDCICSHFEKDVNVVANPTTVTHDAVFAWGGGKFFFLSTPNGTNLTTTTQANDYFANNNVEIAYKLATPTTSSVTPTNLPIKSLSGYNHIESSTGEMEVEYITQQWDAIMTAAQLDNMKVYSTAEQVVGKWVDGSDVYESVIITEFNNATPQYTVDLSNIVGVSTMPVFVSHSVLEAMEGAIPIKQIVMPASSNGAYSSISVNHQSSAVTGKAYLTVRYIKL